MEKLLNSGKKLVTFVSVLAILAVSILSIFTGVSFNASAEADGETETETTVSYPLNGTYDADVVFVDDDNNSSTGSTVEKTVVSDFTGYDPTFWLTAEGNGTANNPFIVETANQFASVTNQLKYDATIETKLDLSKYTINNNVLDTTGLYFKVADNVKAFNMKNTASTVDFSGDMTAEEVKAALADETETVIWRSYSIFSGIFDGNGVVVYGLKTSSNTYGGLFSRVSNNAEIRNLTLKNSYFSGDSAGALVGCNTTTDNLTVRNCSIYNNVVSVTRFNDAITFGGIVVGRMYLDTGKTGTITISNCLVYGNVAKHTATTTYNGVTVEGYDIDYGLWDQCYSSSGAVITDSIILDCVPYSLYYGYNGFYKSSYTNVYTNMTNYSKSNVDYGSNGSVKKEYITTVTANSDGTVTHKFGKATNGTIDNVDYSRTHSAGTLITVDAASVQGSSAKTTLSNLDESNWTFNASGYPTPKLYSVREYSSGEPWTGEVALMYSGGDGSSSSPYTISTPEELALMLLTAESGQYFKLIKDITINDTSVENWTDNAKQWFTSNDVPTFECTLDGNGYTVSGIYYTGKQNGESGGLIPVLGSGGAVKNIKIKDSELNGTSSSVLGAAVGSVADNGAKVIKINAVTVEDSVVFSKKATVGGIIGKIGYSSVYINDSISKSSGLFSDVTGQAKVKRSVSVGAYPFKDAENIVAENVYTDTKALDIEGVTIVDNSDMKGDAAKEKMSGLDFTTLWKAVADDYPAPTGNVASSNGVKGEVWSGEIATGFAGGSGTASDPYIIETAEQLALCVYNTQTGKKYKLAADIYLNDVNGKLWQDKIGCNEWFTQRTVKNASGTGDGFVFDGDGYVVYGIYLNHTDDDYWRAGLFPYLCQQGTIQNLGISESYLAGLTNLSQESIGGLVGFIPDWDSDIEMKDNVRDDATNITNDPTYAAKMPVIRNCFVDHTCYISGYYAGGFVGINGGTVIMENCIFTGSVEGNARDGTSGLLGYDWSYGSHINYCVSLPLTCSRPVGGSSNSDWRSSLDKWVTLAYKDYYFSLYTLTNSYFIKIPNPENFLGENAKTNMDGLDWEEEIGDGGTWRVVDGGTPVLTIFAKHRSDEELEQFSCIGFPAPETTLSFSTGTSDVSVDDITAKMYTKITLPTPTREGYVFKGWHVFDDLSLLYPYDYQPPRNLVLYAEWEALGVIQGFENYTDTKWDYDDTQWTLNKPGAKGGYKNAYVHKGAKSMHLLDTNTESVDVLLNYEDMLTEGQAYTITFWVTTDKENNPATLLTLVHNSKPVYLDTEVASEAMAVATGLKVGEWVQYSYSFTAQTKWVSLRATGNSSLYFDDVMIIPISGTLSGNMLNLGTGSSANGGSLSPNTGDNTVTVAVLVSAIMACAVVAIVSRKNLVETIED